MYTILRRVSNLKNIKILTKKETEEAAKSIQIELSASEKLQIYSPSNIIGPFGIDWSFPSDFAFDPGLLADLGILENVGTLPNIWSSF